MLRKEISTWSNCARRLSLRRPIESNVRATLKDRDIASPVRPWPAAPPNETDLTADTSASASKGPERLESLAGGGLPLNSFSQSELMAVSPKPYSVEPQ